MSAAFCFGIRPINCMPARCAVPERAVSVFFFEGQSFCQCVSLRFDVLPTPCGEGRLYCQGQFFSYYYYRIHLILFEHFYRADRSSKENAVSIEHIKAPAAI